MNNNNISIKLTCVGETRRLGFSGENAPFTYAALLELAKRLFKLLPDKEVR
jgi:hypothetical protein